MATSTEPPIFQHNPLEDAKTHIRLLKVVSVDESRPIRVHCELAAFPIAQGPPYHAISYTWGDAASLASILINGHHMFVRTNCEYALRQASQSDLDEAKGAFIWIDSICVNQHDNDEKGAQVAMMGDIFKTAARVLACVGGHGDGSEFLYQFVRGKGTRIRKFLRSNTPIYADGSFVTESKSFRVEEFAWRWKHSRPFLLQLCEAMAKFLARSYFHRVWIYQELFLGRDISVHCGDEQVPLSWLWVTNSIVVSWLFHTTNYGLFMPLDTLITVRPKIRQAARLLLAGAKEQSLMSFPQAIEDVAKLSCEDPRDRVYGILSITTPVEEHRFQPDYTKDRMDLALEVLQKTTNSLMDGEDDFWLFTLFATRIGLNLNLQDDPSQKLLVATDHRCSTTSLKDTKFDIANIGVGGNGIRGWDFLGWQIRYQQDKWGFAEQRERSRRYYPTSKPSKMTKRLQNNESLSALGDIHLPVEAQDGDWLLIPGSSLWSGQTYPSGRLAFLARHYESEKYEIVGKVLILKWFLKWDNGLEKEAAEFMFYCDYEDLLVLLGACQWDHLWSITDWGDPQSPDTFFRTRFCGPRLSSYAVRAGT